MRFLVAVVVLFACCACESGKGDPGVTTMTKDQVLRRVDELVREAISVLPATARLEVISATAPQACDDPTDNGPKGRVFASNSYWIRDIPKEDTERHVGDLRRWWAEHGFKIVTDAWEKAQVITLENPQDGFRMSLGGPDGDLNIGASSPCVWPNGTPEPTR